MGNEAHSDKVLEPTSDEITLKTDAAKLELEKAKIQAQISFGWQQVIKEVTDKFEAYSTQKANAETRFTTTLTVSILVFLLIIIGTLAMLSWRGIVGGESLLFFLGTLAGSILMLVAERIKIQR